MPSFNNQKTVIITGGATGMGFAMAEQFVERSANVVLNGRQKKEFKNGYTPIEHPTYPTFHYIAHNRGAHAPVRDSRRG